MFKGPFIRNVCQPLGSVNDIGSEMNITARVKSKSYARLAPGEDNLEGRFAPSLWSQATKLRNHIGIRRCYQLDIFIVATG